MFKRIQSDYCTQNSLKKNEMSSKVSNLWYVLYIRKLLSIPEGLQYIVAFKIAGYKFVIKIK